MGKENKKDRASQKSKKYVNKSSKRLIVEAIGDLATYSTMNISKPFGSTVLYKNNIGLLPKKQIELWNLTYLDENKIPFIVGGGKDKSRGMLATLDCQPNNCEQAYLTLVSLYEKNPELIELLKKEKKILEWQVLAQLGLSYTINNPKVELDLVGEKGQIFINPKTENLEGRIVSTITPLVGYSFTIPEEIDKETQTYALAIIEEQKEKLYDIAA